MNHRLVTIYVEHILKGYFDEDLYSRLNGNDPRYVEMHTYEKGELVPRKRTREMKEALKIIQSPLMEELK